MSAPQPYHPNQTTDVHVVAQQPQPGQGQVALQPNGKVDQPIQQPIQQSVPPAYQQQQGQYVNPGYQQPPPQGGQPQAFHIYQDVQQPGMPGQVGQTTVIQQGPQVRMEVVQISTTTPKRDWTTGLCACCADFATCCCAVFCLCCLVCQMTSRMGECCCVPCLPGGMVALRTKMRERYRIQGGICRDHCTMMWCGLCAICQMDRELNRMEEQGEYCNE